MMNKILAAWTVCLLIVGTPAFAVKVTTLYEVKIPVASQAADARTEAIHEGFRDVLMRLTGNQTLDQSKYVRSLIDKAEYYVQEYSYSAPDVNSSTYILNIKFNEQDVKRLLKRSGLKPLSNIRPLVLVWLATVKDHNTDILGGDAGSGLAAKFLQQGQRIGLPLIFPMMDMTDMDSITPENITTVALPEIKKASLRYGPDALLIGTIESDDEGYQGKFDLVMNDKSWDWTSTGDTQDKVFADALDHINQALVQGRR